MADNSSVRQSALPTEWRGSNTWTQAEIEVLAVTSSSNAVGGTDESRGPATGDSVWPDRRFHATRASKIANSVAAVLTGWGLIPNTYLMTTRGRKSGRLLTIPVTLVQQGDQKWLVAPYGPVAWVLNARSAGKVTIRRRSDVAMYTVREIPPVEAGPVLKEYVAIASATRSYFRASKDSPAADFVAEAGQHPVFAITRLPS